MNIASIIKQRRLVLKISQRDLAEIAGISIATIKDIERGAGNPSLRTMELIGTALGLEVTMSVKKTY